MARVYFISPIDSKQVSIRCSNHETLHSIQLKIQDKIGKQVELDLVSTVFNCYKDTIRCKKLESGLKNFM